MPDITKGKTFSSGETVTAADLNSFLDDAVINNDSINAAKIADGAVGNSEVSGSAAISFSKLESLATGSIIAGSAGTATEVAMSGDATIDAAGAVTVTGSSDNAVTLAKLEDGTQGDILYYGASGAPARLGFGTDGQFLKTQGTGANPVWADVAASPFDFITRVELVNGADPTVDVAATSIDISSYVSSSASTLGVTPTVAIVELYADITTSVTQDAEILLKVGDDSSMSHYAYVRAHNVNGSRNDAANSASPTNQALVPIGGTAGSEVLYYSVDLIDALGIDRNYKVELVGFCK